MPITDPYFSTTRCIDRLYEQWKTFKSLIVALDFDNTVYDYHKKGYVFDGVIGIIKKCIDLNFEIFLFTTEEKEEKIKTKLEYLKNNHQIDIKKVNISSIFSKAKKPYYNILLDDRAGLGQAYEILNETIKKIEKEVEKCTNQ